MIHFLNQYFLSDITILIKISIDVAVNNYFTKFTALTPEPGFTTLTGARLYVAVLTVNIWTGNRTVSSVKSSFRTTLRK